MKRQLDKTKGCFIATSLISLGSLVGSFAYPLEQLEVYNQQEYNQFNQPYTKVFIVTEHERNLPYGFYKERSQLVAQIYQTATVQKIGLLAVAILSAGTALVLSPALDAIEVDSEVRKITQESEKQLQLEKIKHQFAMKSKAQKMLFFEELRELAGLSSESETMEADEINATDKFINANYMLLEGHSLDVVVSQVWGYKRGTSEHEEMKQKFLAWQNEGEERE